MKQSGPTLEVAKADHDVSNRMSFLEKPSFASALTPPDVAAAIAHEVSQPLAAILINAEAALGWLEKMPPNLDAAKRSMECVMGNGERATDIARGIRDLT